MVWCLLSFFLAHAGGCCLLVERVTAPSLIDVMLPHGKQSGLPSVGTIRYNSNRRWAGGSQERDMSNVVHLTASRRADELFLLVRARRRTVSFSGVRSHNHNDLALVR